MFCQTCGNPTNDSANFCYKCGASMSNSQPLASDNTNEKQPLSFREYMEARVRSQNQDTDFVSIQKRKTSERMNNEKSRKKPKKDEIVKVI